MAKIAVGINFDTGNAFLCGHDVYAWPERVATRGVRLKAGLKYDPDETTNPTQGVRHAIRQYSSS